MNKENYLYPSTIRDNIENIIFNEPIDIKIITHIINNYDKYEKIIKRNQDNTKKKDYNPKAILCKIRDNIILQEDDTGILKVQYKKGKDSNNLGRFFCKKKIGYQSLSRVIRHTISKNNWLDIDIVNAQPTILYNLCKKYNIKCPVLENYIKNREQTLSQLQEKYKISREDAKIIIISIINCCSSGSYYDLKSFEEEIKKIVDELSLKNTEICITAISNVCKKGKDNIDGGFIALLLQDYENLILGYILEYLEINGFIKKNQVVLMLDGCQVLYDNTLNEDTMKQISKYIYDKTGFTLEIKIKPFDECLELPKDYYNDIDENRALVDLYNSKISDFIEKHNDVIDIAMRNNGANHYIAEICHAFFKDSLQYDIKNECWYYCNIYNIWKKDKKGLFLSKLIPKIISKIFLLRYSYYYSKIAEDELKKDIYEKNGKDCHKITLNCNTDGYIKSVINRCISLFASDDFYEKCLDSKGNLFAFKNKVYDFNTYILRNIKPDDYILTHTGYIYPEYDDKDVKKNIIDFFRSIYINEEMIEYILDIIVLTLNGNRKIQQFNIFTGTGSNGKSLLIYILETILGDYVLKLNPETLTKPNDKQNATSELYLAKGKRLIYTNEPENNKDTKLQVGRLKELAGIGGKEKIKARGLYENPIEFSIQFMLYILCNDKPSLSNVDGGIARRINVINHLVKFVDEPSENNKYMKKKDIELFDKFGTDIYRNTFILMLLERWNNITSKITIFKRPEQVIRDSAEYIENSNEVLGYISEHFEITQNIDDKYQAGMLLNEFRRTGSIISNDTFKVRILEIGGITWKKTKNGAFFYGLKKIETNNFIDE